MRSGPTGSRDTIAGVKRRLFNLFATVSLLFFVGLSIIWFRSYTGETGIEVFGEKDYRDPSEYDPDLLHLSAINGTLALVHQRMSPEDVYFGPDDRRWHTSSSAPRQFTRHDFAGEF